MSKEVIDHRLKTVEMVEKLHKTIYNQDQKISDLETKLAECEKKNFELVAKINLKEHKPAFCTLADRDCEALGQAEKLKQQLHDLPKKVVEDITNELSNNTSLYFEMRESTSAHCPNQEYEWFNYVRFRDYVNAILKKYGVENE